MTDDDFAAYAKIDAVNWSTLKEMQKSPKHYRHALATSRKDTAAMALGRAVHTAVFEPDRFALEYALWKGDRRAGKTWEAFKAAHPGETILKVDDYMRCIAIRDSVRAHPVAATYLAKGIGEQTITWTDAVTGLTCKSRLDWHCPARRVLVDLKTSRDIEARGFSRTVARLGYHAQLAMYSDGLAANLGGDVEVVIVAVESAPPYDVGVFHLDADVLYAGREDYRHLLARVKECRALDHWPGKYVERQSLELPPWVYGDDSITDDDDIVFGQGEMTNGL